MAPQCLLLDSEGPAPGISLTGPFRQGWAGNLLLPGPEILCPGDVEFSFFWPQDPLFCQKSGPGGPQEPLKRRLKRLISEAQITRNGHFEGRGPQIGKKADFFGKKPDFSGNFPEIPGSGALGFPGSEPWGALPPGPKPLFRELAHSELLHTPTYDPFLTNKRKYRYKYL